MHRTRATIVAALAITLAALPAGALAQSPDPVATELDAVRAATAQNHWLPFAIADGYAPFALDGGATPTCFDNDAGGMGVHYVKGVDEVVDALAPEAMVYEVTEFGETRLGAVEYIVPQEIVEDAQGKVVNLPELFGQQFHKHSTLPLYVLHAWIWAENPDGMFADFNPRTHACMAM